MLQDPDISTRFYAYEVYKDEAALDAHRQTAHYHRCVAELEPLMTQPRQKKLFKWIYPEIISDE